ncbi:MAG: hypothetical protein ACRC0A_05815, partial [Chitinophagaceae bacterium]
MIHRYSRKKMANIWTEQNKFNAYLEIEICAAEAWEKLGIITEKEITLIRKNATFSISRIYEIEAETKHDIVA